jgi:hypothetical protein
MLIYFNYNFTVTKWRALQTGVYITFHVTSLLVLTPAENSTGSLTICCLCAINFPAFARIPFLTTYGTMRRGRYLTLSSKNNGHK